jgi:hypothetical protein
MMESTKHWQVSLREYKCRYPQTTIIDLLFLLFVFSVVGYAFVIAVVSTVFHILESVFGVVPPLNYEIRPIDETIPFIDTEVHLLLSMLVVFALFAVSLYILKFMFWGRLLELKELYKTQQITWTLSDFRKALSHFMVDDFLVIVFVVIMILLVNTFGSVLGLALAFIFSFIGLIELVAINEFGSDYVFLYFELVGGYEDGEEAYKLHTNRVTLLGENSKNGEDL